MRLLVVLVLAVAGWVAAAPGSPTSKKDTSEDLQQEQQQEETENDNLAPALSELARRKRGSTKSNLPYSNYRPSGGMHRYRYPLYHKRSYRPQPSYDYEDEVVFPGVAGVESDYDYDNQLRGPSLFRERSLQQDRKKKEMLLEDEGYFTDDYVPEKRVAPPAPFVMPLKKKDAVYNLATTPYDLHTIGRMYEMGKRDEAPYAPSPYDLEGVNEIHSVGRKSPPRMLSPSEQFYDALDSIKRKKAIFDERIMNPSDAERLEHLINMKNFLSSASSNRYLRGSNPQEMSLRDPMIRKKRDTSVTASTPAMAKTNSTTTANNNNKDLASTVPARYKQAQLSGDRRKRAFNDYFNWERNALESEYQPIEKRSSNKDFNDFLTREYFKSIARSVGQKKKRMAYAQFEADKRSSGIDEFLENPAMLEYMQTKLREAEEEVAIEAEKELGGGDREELLSNIVVRLDALERMREALKRLEELQNEKTARPQRAMPSGLSVGAVKKRSKSSGVPPAVAAPSAPNRVVESRKKKSAIDARKLRRLRRREDILPKLFLGNTREDCPVLDRVIMNCVGVSTTVGDQDKVFLEPCIRHEVCYMCGSSLSMSGHECNAILSSSLEAACSWNLDCLSAAGDTFNLLDNADRYGDDGTCTHDPCIMQFLESR